MEGRSPKQGGCHCGAVAWEADLPDEVHALVCNCSICDRIGFEHVIVPAAHFRLLRGEAALTRYTFNTGVAQHLFCRVCGVKSHYIPRSNPDGVSLNLRCMDQAQFRAITKAPLDGQNWEESAAKLGHLSKAP